MDGGAVQGATVIRAAVRVTDPHEFETVTPIVMSAKIGGVVTRSGVVPIVTVGFASSNHRHVSGREPSMFPITVARVPAGTVRFSRPPVAKGRRQTDSQNRSSSNTPRRRLLSDAAMMRYVPVR